MKPLLMHKSKIGQNGFTLIELMITFAIIAILATIAIPAYSEYVKQGKVSQATSTLSEMRIRFEQYFQDNRTYVGVDCTAPADAGNAFSYGCSVTPTATAYTIQAEGQNDMASFLYTIDQDNAKTSNYDGTGVANCWITKKGGSC